MKIIKKIINFIALMRIKRMRKKAADKELEIIFKSIRDIHEKKEEHKFMGAVGGYNYIIYTGNSYINNAKFRKKRKARVDKYRIKRTMKVI